MTEKMAQCVNMGPCAQPGCLGQCSRCIRDAAEWKNKQLYGSMDYPGVEQARRATLRPVR